MLAAKYFMWSYQAYFQVSAQVAAETTFQRLDPRFEPLVFLVGFQVRDRPDRLPICVVPDDCVYPPEGAAERARPGQPAGADEPRLRRRPGFAPCGRETP